ncbi:hypothetical protein PhCBS80983_g03469 [Powellomyces hirtus]|uniref:Ribonuclease P/MRP protein subunit POP5 n=1 Tax=Powellomyces hirtus TaxID=109895 RepID=A0A507E3W7_9FUNG|nr:hypothetical protein PhCBS80983_g03469 [Powellomyces hirtus]
MVRFKNRFLLFHIHYEGTPNRAPPPIDTTIHGGHISSVLKESILLNFGDFGAGIAATSTGVKYFSPYTSTGIIRCSRDHYQMVWAALTFVTTLRGRNVLFRVVHVGGTIKSAQQETMKLDKKLLNELETTGVITASQTDLLLEKARKEIEAVDA